jgi:hypothetical protein
MNVMKVLERIKAGEKVMVTLPSRAGCEKKYSLTDGTEVPGKQFAKISPFLIPADAGLIAEADPQSYQWAG